MNSWKQLRLEAGFATQREAAEYLEVSEKTVQSWESETNTRTPPKAVELCYIARRILTR
ncbi:MAG: helix-turn-helix transcriptional regulator [Pontiellaceae bacterium]|nr:helix-turn-helix transcriptional regulator [Pontiellaceae bacterium]